MSQEIIGNKPTKWTSDVLGVLAKWLLYSSGGVLLLLALVLFSGRGGSSGELMGLIVIGPILGLSLITSLVLFKIRARKHSISNRDEPVANHQTRPLSLTLIGYWLIFIGVGGLISFPIMLIVSSSDSSEVTFLSAILSGAVSAVFVLVGKKLLDGVNWAWKAAVLLGFGQICFKGFMFSQRFFSNDDFVRGSDQLENLFDLISLPFYLLMLTFLIRGRKNFWPIADEAQPAAAPDASRR